MKILLFLLALGLLVSPVVAALPGPAQKRREQLRRALMQKGVAVRLGAGPAVKSRAFAADHHTARCSLALPSAGPPAPRFAVRDGAGWRIQGCSTPGEQRRLQAVLADFPAAVNAAEITAHDAAAWWREQGEPEDVERMHRGLLELRNLYCRRSET